MCGACFLNVDQCLSTVFLEWNLFDRLDCSRQLMPVKQGLVLFQMDRNITFLSHTGTVVRECFKGDEASQWKRPKFDPSLRQNPLTDLHRNWQAWLRPGRHPKFCSDRFRGFCSPNMWFCHAFGVTSFLFVFWGSSIRLQPTPLNGFLCKIRQKTYFYAKYVRRRLLGKEVPFEGLDNYILYLDP